MTPKNIHAYTPAGSSFPPYLSLNDEPDGRITLTVRSPATSDGNCGLTAMIVLPEHEMYALAASIVGRKTKAE